MALIQCIKKYVIDWLAAHKVLPIKLRITQVTVATNYLFFYSQIWQYYLKCSQKAGRKHFCRDFVLQCLNLWQQCCWWGKWGLTGWQITRLVSVVAFRCISCDFPLQHSSSTFMSTVFHYMPNCNQNRLSKEVSGLVGWQHTHRYMGRELQYKARWYRNINRHIGDHNT